MRTQAGLSQSELAGQLEVTAKAVSKWETGAAMPKTQSLRRLAAILGVSVEELLDMKEERRQPVITKIVVTGGPCAGKTTGMSWIQNAFTERGYRVLFVPETATELISGGVAPWTCESNAKYQNCQMKLQIEKEKIFGMTAETMAPATILVVFVCMLIAFARYL